MGRYLVHGPVVEQAQQVLVMNDVYIGADKAFIFIGLGWSHIRAGSPTSTQSFTATLIFKRMGCARSRTFAFSRCGLRPKRSIVELFLH